MNTRLLENFTENFNSTVISVFWHFNNFTRPFVSPQNDFKGP